MEGGKGTKRSRVRTFAKSSYPFINTSIRRKQHMMREHQEIIKALQTQFQEYRKTAEVLFKAEASKLKANYTCKWKSTKKN